MYSTNDAAFSAANYPVSGLLWHLRNGAETPVSGDATTLERASSSSESAS